ncbi:hypothetical protein LTR91_024504 [Friedmanniomyces endolithicus]|uniref:NAD-dependent epimerase/dehydratase domain-containing protein n=1 Tax=Friedmanniomyces endolithicus TaxID=329885 RepID=A0AAN6H6W6_9PEZI|nr:hypothetical protein LTR35_017976 [Friedmanniomyces endolithicus]KAK0266913.1 hypothetical protein LTS00_017912 [Friedmanniomyces endolithicus]KAK0301753.1 hypothetical protein LTR01_009179 [Friedmanniomyces endolithicus]KAK0822576.1 hypothetical protein LTR73_009208 [Friedmanniomyces endolithicus]KAK0890229.1 hypothetical protein LTR57_025179 [Friedmanniomyces endolithicus]
MDSKLVLITGVTGHIGFRVLQYALEYGFAVRAVVRSQAKADTVRSNSALRAVHQNNQLEIVLVPDFTVPHAFDAVVQGVDYIIHCASPIPFAAPTSDDPENDFIRPAVNATLGIFQSAARAPSVKPIVITSSCIAVAPVAAALVDTGNTYTADTRQPEMDGQWPPGTQSFVTYAAGKVAALNRTEAWMRDKIPHFDAIHVMPAYVLGHVGMADDLQGRQQSPSRLVLNVVRGREKGNEDPPGLAMVVSHVDDCARIHLEALGPNIDGNQSFIICYDCGARPEWDEAKAIVEQNFPTAVNAGTLPCKGSLESVVCRLDSSKTEKTFGFRHTYKDAVVSLVEQYLDLHKKQQGKRKD